MSRETNTSSTKEQLRDQIKSLKSAREMYRNQQDDLSKNVRAFNNANRDFIGYGIAESVNLEDQIRNIDEKIRELEAQLKA